MSPKLGSPCPTWSPQMPFCFCSGARGLLLGVLAGRGLGPCCRGDVAATSAADFWGAKGGLAKYRACSFLPGHQPHTYWQPFGCLLEQEP